jgi:hypothetical protein
MMIRSYGDHTAIGCVARNTSLRESWDRSVSSAESQRGAAYRHFDTHCLLLRVYPASPQRGELVAKHIVPSLHQNVCIDAGDQT